MFDSDDNDDVDIGLNVNLTIYYFKDKKKSPTSIVSEHQRISYLDLTTKVVAKIQRYFSDQTVATIETKLGRTADVIENGTILGGGMRCTYVYETDVSAVFVIVEM